MKAERPDVSVSKREFLGNYHVGKNREGKVYWGLDAHQPVEIDIVRIRDGAVLLTLRKCLEDVDILEVESILRNNGRLATNNTNGHEEK